MLLKLNAGRLSIPLGYILFFGITLHLTPCVGQGVSDFQLFRDSLYQHISWDMRAEIHCHFDYEQGSGMITSYLGSNQNELNKLDVFIRQALSHPDYSISHIRLTAYSSIEGDYARNETLTRERAEYFHAYLQVRYPELYHKTHSLAWVAEDWQGLSKLVRGSSIVEREEILEIIRKIRVYDDRESLLMKLNGGSAYCIMERTMFPQLRRVELQIEYTANSSDTLRQEKRQGVATDTLDPLVYNILEKDMVDLRDNRSLALAQNRVIQEIVGFKSGTSPYGYSSFPKEENRFAIKTNMLLCAGVQHNFKYTTPVANVALEYYISNHYSIELGGIYSYWRFNSNQKFQGISGYRLESRYNFSFLLSGRFGAYLGIYGRVGDYDIRKMNNTINYTGDYWDTGLSAGLNIDLVGRLGLELGTRVGYLHTRPIKYTMDNQYNCFEKQYKYYQFMVTDLNVSLIYRFR